jgi:NAD(P)-dependent dehydrogenase (short-subunit alcohol dehydrogenase family)
LGTNLAGKRVLVLGAETEVGRGVTTAVAEAGASVAAVAATSDAEAAFAVQRLARRLSSGERKVIAQAIDATNEAAVRVMVRQVSKELGGLDAVVDCTLAYADPWRPTEEERVPHRFILRYGSKELERGSSGRFIEVRSGSWEHLLTMHEGDKPPSWQWDTVSVKDRPVDVIVPEVVAAIAGEADSG